jgi:two-component sensor histidine kinase
MAGLLELARAHTALNDDQIDHLQRLAGSWGLLADLCFADLLLFAPVGDDGDQGYIVLGQIRPTTSQTLYHEDWVGWIADAGERPVVSRCFDRGEMIEGEISVSPIGERIRVECIPIRHEGEEIGVLTRESASSVGRAAGELERTYVEVFNRFARMMSAGAYPFVEDDSDSEERPRVGDGVILLDRDRRVEFHSPNGVSALHRIGVNRAAEGQRLSDVGLEDEVVRNAFSFARPVTVEVERPGNVVVVIRCIPLLERGEVTGAVVLIRDISELRRRDLLLLSKDATIREIHHRVKNNLQTISSLLRLQARRASAPEARAAIEESVNRIRSISLVHEILSRDAGDDVPFLDVLRPLLRTVEEGLVPDDYHIRFRLVGDAGKLPASIATPLAVVLTELLQNVVEHAYPGEEGPVEGTVEVAMATKGNELTVTVTDDGVGLPSGFNLEESTGLGLSIVQTLVTTELGGTIRMEPRPEGTTGSVAEVRVPTVETEPSPLELTASE